MTFPTLPSENVAWAESNVTAADPGNTKRAAGYAVAEAPPAEWFNWQLRAAGRWIAYLVGQLAAVVLSNWTKRDTGITNACEAIVYASHLDRWFAVFGGVIYRATDPGGSWTSCSAGTGIARLAYGNGTIVAVGAGGECLTSTDGTTWTARTVGTSDFLYSAAYGDGVWVLVGGNTNGLIRVSSDLATWAAPSSPPTLTGVVLTGVVYSAELDRWIAVGGSTSYHYTSQNASGTWVAVAHNTLGFGVWSDVAWDGVLFYAVGTGYGSYSADGLTWAFLSWTDSSLDRIRRVLYVPSLQSIVAIGSNNGGTVPYIKIRASGKATPDAAALDRSPAGAYSLVSLGASDRVVAIPTDENTNSKILTSLYR